MTEGTEAQSSPKFRAFICIHSDEGKNRAEELMAEVKRRLAVGSEELMPSEVTEENFLTAVVTSLNWDFNAQITRIGNDQWSGVWAESYDGSFSTFIQCDKVEHGVAATWKAFADHANTGAEKTG